MKQDAAIVGNLFDQLINAGLDPWLDERKLVLGDNWQAEIASAVAQSDAFIVCLRPEFNGNGFRQQEVRWALEALNLRPPGTAFIIPFVVEPCELPQWVRPFHAGKPTAHCSTFDEVVTSLEKHFGWQRRRAGSLGYEKLYSRLTEIVLSSSSKRALYVAIGEADFVRSWLSRLLARLPDGMRPALSKVVLLGLHPRRAASLERRGLLPQGFAIRMEANIAALTADLSRNKVKVERRYWKGDPVLHGFMYGLNALYGEWGRRNGQLSYRTPLLESTFGDGDDSGFRNMRRLFRIHRSQLPDR